MGIDWRSQKIHVSLIIHCHQNIDPVRCQNKNNNYYLDTFLSCQLKAQIPVLKKAYLDEQAEHNELKVSFQQMGLINIKLKV